HRQQERRRRRRRADAAKPASQRSPQVEDPEVKPRRRLDKHDIIVHGSFRPRFVPAPSPLRPRSVPTPSPLRPHSVPAPSLLRPHSVPAPSPLLPRSVPAPSLLPFPSPIALTPSLSRNTHPLCNRPP